MKCYLVEKSGDEVQSTITDVDEDRLPPGEVTIAVRYSSLNYKDAMAAQGNPGVAKSLPHIPGIDAAGVVESDTSDTWKSGQNVLVTGYGLGAACWGGWAEKIRVPAEWVVPLPESLTALEAMTLGTAGFTAAQCVASLVEHGVAADDGDILVTGATGGVGSLALMLLAKLGYSVTAVTGKTEQHDWLRELGAANILGRDDVVDSSERPLLKARWAGSVDTVGGQTLATTVRSLDHRGCVSACGLVGGADLPLTVYPFLLRGVTLDGIDSAQCPRPRREEIWRRLSGQWRLDDLANHAEIVSLGDLPEQVEKILAGKVKGRVVVDLHA